MEDALVEAISGAVGAALSTAVLYPLEIAKTIMTSRTGKAAAGDSTVSVLKERVATSGILSVYAGLPTKTLQSVVQSFGYYYFYSGIKQVRAHTRAVIQRSIMRCIAHAQALNARSGGKDLSLAQNIVAGYFAGVLNMGASLPLEVRA